MALVLGLVFIELFNFSFFSVTVWGIDLDYRDAELFTLERNRAQSVVFQTVPKYCISDSFTDYEGYYIFSKGFLPRFELNSPHKASGGYGIPVKVKLF